MTKSGYPTPVDPATAQWVSTLDDDAREFFEERSAVYEYEAGMSRALAEAEAKIATGRYLAQRPPCPNTAVSPPKDRQ